MANPEELPESPESDLVRRVTDHVSGMTDRYALREFRLRFMPREGPL
jgi:dGTP triphosphohydrolase